MFRDMSSGHGENIKRPESVEQIELVPLYSKGEIEAVLKEIGRPNLLKERTLLEKLFDRGGDWLAHVQSEYLDKGGRALAFKEAGTTIGFVLVDPEGVIAQLRAIQGKDEQVMREGLEALKYKGFEHLSATLKGENKDIQQALHELAGFEERGEDEGGGTVMEKE